MTKVQIKLNRLGLLAEIERLRAERDRAIETGSGLALEAAKFQTERDKLQAALDAYHKTRDGIAAVREQKIRDLVAKRDALLAAAQTKEPVLTDEQRVMLTGVNITAILPRIEIFTLGWREAMGYVRAAINATEGGE